MTRTDVCRQTGKITYPSRGDAKDHVTALNRKFRKNHWRAYRCPHCRNWHVGREQLHGGVKKRRIIGNIWSVPVEG